LFDVLPVGAGKELALGAPVVSFFVNGKDLKTLLEFFDGYRRVSSNFAAVFSPSLSVEFRKWGIPFFAKLKALRVRGEPVDRKRLYGIGTNAFAAGFLVRLPELSYGLIRVVCRNAKGDPAPPQEVVPYGEALLLSRHFRAVSRAE